MKLFNSTKKSAAILCVVVGTVFAQEQKLTLDEAIVESVRYLSGKLDAGTEVAVLRFDSDRKKLSDYIIDESCIRIINSPKLSLVEARNLNRVFYDASEQEMIEAGKTLGAASVVFGSIQKLGEDYRFRIQSLSVETGKIQAAQSFAVISDKTLMGLLGVEQYNLSGGKENNKEDYASKPNGVYVSLRYSIEIPWSFVGGDFEVGGIFDNFFFSGDFRGGGAGVNYFFMGGGVSFGGRIQPKENFQIIVGGSAGCWYTYDYYYYYSYSYSYFYFYENFFFGGPFVKFLWGKNGVWFEWYNRVLVGMGVSGQVGVGVTYSPSRRK